MIDGSTAIQHQCAEPATWGQPTAAIAVLIQELFTSHPRRPLFDFREPGTVTTHPRSEALAFSFASFQSHGFFPQGITLDDPSSIFVASEAILDQFIQTSVSATLIQRSVDVT